MARWQHIWLNEGFATYAEWLWDEHEGIRTAQEDFNNFYSIPEDDPFWTLTIGDPGTDQLFDIPIYWRGAMTLHQLRLRIGDDAFFRLLRTWARTQEGGNVTTPQFIRLAERISGRDLDAFFTTWLFTPSKPVVPTAAAAASRARASAAADPGVAAMLQRLRGQQSPLRR